MPTLGLHVPPAHRNLLEELARLPENRAQSLVDSLDKLSPSQPASYSKIAEKCGESVEFVSRLVAAMRGLFDLQPSDDTERGEIAAAVAADQELKLESSERTVLSERLVSLLESSVLARISKALVLQLEHPNIFRDSRIFTDVRPVFDEPLGEEVSAAVVAHVLKIEYFDSSENLDQLFVVLDDDDLRNLHRVVERELEKTANLENFFQRAGLARFNLNG